jgi:hypothetical protein
MRFANHFQNVPTLQIARHGATRKKPDFTGLNYGGINSLTGLQASVQWRSIPLT